MKKILIITIVIVAAAIGAGVWKLMGSFQKAGQLGDAAVAEFHNKLNAANDEGILTDAHEKFRADVKVEKLRAITGHVRERLGKFQSAERNGIQMNNNNGNNVLTLNYAAKYEKGDASESYTFDYNGDAPLMLGFNVESPLLKD